MEDAYVIYGGKPLKGNIKLSGAKNIALKVIIASLLFENEVVLHNIPRINDVFALLDLIKHLGGTFEFNNNTLRLQGKTLEKNRVDLLHGSHLRASFMLFAPLLHRFKECYVPNPGGCRIGARPIDRIVDGMKQMGVRIAYDSETGYYHATLSEKTHGTYRFQKPSHTGTELLILLGIMGNGRSVIHNAALEPEIDELIRFLNAGGAKVRRDNNTIIIDPVDSLSQKEPFTIISDRNEAVTYATLAIATKGDIVIHDARPNLLKKFLAELAKVGGGIEKLEENQLRFFYKGDIKSSRIETAPHPGFMTDWQPNWAVLMTQANGESIIGERVFENRFSYVDELKKVGAEIDYVKLPVSDPREYFFFNFDPKKKYNQTIRIKGQQELHGGALTIADLRAGATLAIAALIAEGESVISGASILERGYERFVEKIRMIGGSIKKYD
ncbi:UDP-N-acetylglucosamine 1-carboxyvinyltransferase [Candidatus Roizmanbacteria bacterium]|nr:UDP-N-acetylglucosamine 1-carboxyvinyltransferase [Candidatus Roizmanbacteria bacterium]